MIIQGELAGGPSPKPSVSVVRPVMAPSNHKSFDQRFLLCKYVRVVDNIRILSIFVYDKLEQIISYRNQCNQAGYRSTMEDVHKNFTPPSLQEVVMGNWPEEDQIFIRDSKTQEIIARDYETEIVSKYVTKTPNISLHIKRLGQVHELLSKYNIDLNEVEARFLKESGTSAIYIWSLNKGLNRGDMKIIYEYRTGIFTYYFKGIRQTSDYSLEEIFKSHIL